MVVDKQTVKLKHISIVSLKNIDYNSQTVIQNIYSVVLFISKSFAIQNSFSCLQHVSIIHESDAIPALLICDNKLKNDVAILDEEVCLSSLQYLTDVTLSPECSWLYIDKLVLNIQEKPELVSQLFINKLKNELIQSDVILKEGMNIKLIYFGSEYVVNVSNLFFLFENEHSSFGKCFSQTDIEVTFSGHFSSFAQKVMCWSDFGGYFEQLGKLKEIINNDFSSKIKTDGVLISGTLGCGKSFLGKILSYEYKDKFIKIEGSEFMSKYRGETEMNLRNIFQRAFSRLPCILFINDIHMMCEDREISNDDDITNIFLHYLDGVESSQTCEPNKLDSALRRPGRISTDIIFHLPEKEDREDILNKLFSRVSNCIEKSDLLALAERTAGFSGSDLCSLVTEASYMAKGTVLTADHMLSAIYSVKPSALRDACYILPQNIQNKHQGYNEIKKHFSENITLMLNHAEKFYKFGISPPSRYLLFGPSGCGKTTLVHLMGCQHNLPVIYVKRSDVLGKYYGESEKNLAAFFRKARDAAPCILLFENFEGLAGHKKNHDEGRMDVEGRIINFLKSELDGITTNNKLIVICETNRPDLLDKVCLLCEQVMAHLKENAQVSHEDIKVILGDLSVSVTERMLQRYKEFFNIYCEKNKYT